MAATNSRILSSHDLSADDLGTYTTGGYTPVAMSTAVMTLTQRHQPGLNLANFGDETAGSGRCEPAALITFSETLTGCPVLCDVYDSMSPLCSSSLSGTYNRCLLTSRHLFEKSRALTNLIRCPVHKLYLYCLFLSSDPHLGLRTSHY